MADKEKSLPPFLEVEAHLVCLLTEISNSPLAASVTGLLISFAKPFIKMQTRHFIVQIL